MKFHLPTIHFQVRAVSFREVSRLTKYMTALYIEGKFVRITRHLLLVSSSPKMGSRFNDPC